VSKPRPFSDPTEFYPIRLPDGSRHKGTVFLRAAVSHPRIEVGEYTHFSSHQPLLESAEIVSRLVPYLYERSV